MEAFCLTGSVAFHDQNNDISATQFSGYLYNGEYIFDELKRLDLKIRLHIMYQHHIQSHSANEQLKGLVLFEEEITRLLDETDAVVFDSDMYEIQEKIEKLNVDIHQKCTESLNQSITLPLLTLTHLFNLTKFEEQAILMAFAIDFNRKYEKLFAFLQDDVTSNYPTIDLAMKLFCESPEERIEAHHAFYKNEKLHTYFFSEEENIQQTAKSYLSKPLKLDKRIVHYILGINEIDERIFPYTTLIHTEQQLRPLHIHVDIQEQLQAFVSSTYALNNGEQHTLTINLYGKSGAGKKLQAKHLCQHLNSNLLLVDTCRLFDQDLIFKQAIEMIVREAILQKSAICFFHTEKLFQDTDTEANQKILRQFSDAMQTFHGLVFLLSETPIQPKWYINKGSFVAIELKISQDERIKVWEKACEGYNMKPEIDFGQLTSKYRLTYGQILNILKFAQHLARWNNNDAEASIGLDELHKASHQQMEHKLSKKATRINPAYSWKDIILPAEQVEELQDATNQIKYRYIVFGEWGFEGKLSYGKGLSMLFTGPPGTGKTMSAQVVANELQLELYKIDLSQVVSKYIGETEKNLQEIFSEAQNSHAILFFDEMDALFGKRSEVKDAHDKYANIETSYLLQKMEEYEGISILASNFIQNIDDAFMRRINFVIKFPFPDSLHREKIWRSMFPKQAPLDADIEFSLLANKLEISGGNIKNIALSSAFLAAEKGESINMKHIMKAAKHELKKSGKILLKQDLEEYFM